MFSVKFLSPVLKIYEQMENMIMVRNFHMLLMHNIAFLQRSWYFAAIMWGLFVTLYHLNENLDINKRKHILKFIYPHILLKVFKRKWGLKLSP